MIVRKLVSLYKGDVPRTWYFDFAYYEKDEHGILEWTGDSEHGTVTEDEMYELVKPKLKLEYTEVRRR